MSLNNYQLIPKNIYIWQQVWCRPGWPPNLLFMEDDFKLFWDRVSPCSSWSRMLGLKAYAIMPGNFQLLSSKCWDYRCAWPQLLLKIYFLCMSVCLHAYMCTIYKSSAGGSQRKASDPLSLKLQTVDCELPCGCWTEMCVAQQNWLWAVTANSCLYSQTITPTIGTFCTVY